MIEIEMKEKELHRGFTFVADCAVTANAPGSKRIILYNVNVMVLGDDEFQGLQLFVKSRIYWTNKYYVYPYLSRKASVLEIYDYNPYGNVQGELT